jgi:hypothetical protein
MGSTRCTHAKWQRRARLRRRRFGKLNPHHNGHSTWKNDTTWAACADDFRRAIQRHHGTDRNHSQIGLGENHPPSMQGQSHQGVGWGHAPHPMVNFLMKKTLVNMYIWPTICINLLIWPPTINYTCNWPPCVTFVAPSLPPQLGSFAHQGCIILAAPPTTSCSWTIVTFLRPRVSPRNLQGDAISHRRMSRARSTCSGEQRMGEKSIWWGSYAAPMPPRSPAQWLHMSPIPRLIRPH